MISKKMQDALNGQVTAEYHSAYLYLSMSTYLQSIDLPGCARWMRVQYQEETLHAEKILDHVVERDGRAILKEFEAPPTKWKSVLDAFDSALKHERKITGMINHLVDIAIAEKDHASQAFLQWL